MDIDWGKVMMDPVVQGAIITAAGAVTLAALAGFFKIILSFRDKKLFEEIKAKIGNHKSDTIEGQHDNIEKTIVNKTNNLKDNIANIRSTELLRISNKVEGIDRLLSKKEIEDKFRLNSMNDSQKEIKIHIEGINKIANDWERVIAENKELKGRIAELEKKNKELIEIISKSKRRSKDIEL